MLHGGIIKSENIIVLFDYWSYRTLDHNRLHPVGATFLEY